MKQIEARNNLGAYTEALIADILDKREEMIINTAMTALRGGRSIDPMMAVQLWISLSEARLLRASLIGRTVQENVLHSQKG